MIEVLKQSPQDFCIGDGTCQLVRVTLQFTWASPTSHVNHILMASLGSNVGTLLPSWDLLTWVGVGSWDPV